MALVTSNVVLPTVYGSVIVNRHDINQFTALALRGKAVDHEEIQNLAQFIEPGTGAIDVGACFGLWTLGFAARAAVVYSFEAQRALYQCICGTLALNSIENVLAYNYAVGSSRGLVDIPKYNYHEKGQFGAVSILQSPVQSDGIGQEPTGQESVRMISLDDLNLTNISVIKIDVEGMDFEVLKGARETIERCRPCLYLEMLLTGDQQFTDFLTPLGYSFFPIELTQNFLALPKEKYEAESSTDNKIVVRRRISS